uniref:ARAD1C45738p n=1 Tax=Blastobotrys adeninivorans TaxID=409370 RepID=A0A060T4J5_BLAAD
MDTISKPSSREGSSLKYASLLTLTIQNAAFNIVMHYSLTVGFKNPEDRYYASTVVFLNEVVKFIASLAISIKQEGVRMAWRHAFSHDCYKLAIPATLYTLQNSLLYVGSSNLSVASFQVSSQLRILTTAFFTVIILKRKLNRAQWIALFTLAIGIALVQLPPEIVAKYFTMVTSGTWKFELEQSEALQTGVDNKSGVDMNQMVGLAAVVGACSLSGLAGVYFEKVLKGSETSLWTRNVQMSFFSLFPAALIGVVGKDGAKISQNGFFHGYSTIVWAVIFLQAFGGLVVAVCVKYSNNIAKNFATSVSILLSCIASVVYFDDFELSANFAIGASLVMYATHLYSTS